MANVKRNHSFNWLKRQFRNVGFDYTLFQDRIHLNSPFFYTFRQDKSNPNYFEVSHPDCFGKFSVTITHNYDFVAFVEKLLKYEQMFHHQIYTRKTLRQQLQPRDEEKTGYLRGNFNI